MYAIQFKESVKYIYCHVIFMFTHIYYRFESPQVAINVANNLIVVADLHCLASSKISSQWLSFFNNPFTSQNSRNAKNSWLWCFLRSANNVGPNIWCNHILKQKHMLLTCTDLKRLQIIPYQFWMAIPWIRRFHSFLESSKYNILAAQRIGVLAKPFLVQSSKNVVCCFWRACRTVTEIIFFIFYHLLNESLGVLQ